MRHTLALALILGLAFGHAATASACAACGCGDPTLTSAGVEQPFAGRLRTSVELRYRSDVVGEAPLEEYRIHEARAEASVAWAPSSRLFLVGAVPFVYRTVTTPSLARHRITSVGDVEVRAKAFLYKDRELAPRFLFAAVGGLKLPTAPWHDGENGERFPFEAQPGTGSWDVLAGLTGTAFWGLWSAHASAHAALPVATRDPYAPGPSLRMTLAAQYQALPWLALRPGLDGRLDGTTEESSAEDPNSGGFVAFAGGDVLVSPVTDWTFAVGARMPFVNALHGRHDEGVVAMASGTVDW